MTCLECCSCGRMRHPRPIPYNRLKVRAGRDDRAHMKLTHNRLEVAAAILFTAAAIVMWTVSVVAGLPVFFAAVACIVQSRARDRRASAAQSDDAA